MGDGLLWGREGLRFVYAGTRDSFTLLHRPHRGRRFQVRVPIIRLKALWIGSFTLVLVRFVYSVFISILHEDLKSIIICLSSFYIDLNSSSVKF